jgi:hypothetical protein
MCLLPVSWIVAAFVVLALLWLIAEIRHSTILHILKTDSLWPLAIFLPGFIFGKIVGLIASNFICYFTPPLRQIFENESKTVGRRDFSSSMKGLYLCASVTGAFTILGSTLYLVFA